MTCKVSNATSCLLYSKLFKVSKSSCRLSKGEMNNLVTTDAIYVESMIWQLPYHSSNLLTILISCYALYSMIGLIFIYGVVIIVVTGVGIYYISKLQTKLYESISENSDDRANLLSEIIDNIKVIKINSYLESFTDRIGQIRKTEYRNAVYESLIEAPETFVSSVGYSTLVLGIFSV
mmetsp:Transcript_41923/g.48534  ORF Transcript_41923/g.48534 Transcript_41923/m.48534 type:complete len:177 (-) Transcript_41923:1539-2069(-)